MYLLDTDTLSNHMKRGASPNLVAKLATVPVDAQFTTSITLGELLYGAYRRSEHSSVLLASIESVLTLNLAILPFDAAAARLYGTLRADLERMGTPLAEADLRIAAIALAENLTLVTGNMRHFQRVPGLRFENWLG